MEARAIDDAMFYYGPVWREHRKTVNDLLTDSDNVLLLRPLSLERGVTILPAVDPVAVPKKSLWRLSAQSRRTASKLCQTSREHVSQLSSGRRARDGRADHSGCGQ